VWGVFCGLLFVVNDRRCEPHLAQRSEVTA
jgi:hypothetical protein